MPLKMAYLLAFFKVFVQDVLSEYQMGLTGLTLHAIFPDAGLPPCLAVPEATFKKGGISMNLPQKVAVFLEEMGYRCHSNRLETSISVWFDIIQGPPPTFLQKLFCSYNRRAVNIGSILVRSPEERESWVLDIRGRENLKIAQAIAQRLTEEFSVEVDVRLKSENTMHELVPCGRYD